MSSKSLEEKIEEARQANLRRIQREERGRQEAMLEHQKPVSGQFANRFQHPLGSQWQTKSTQLQCPNRVDDLRDNVQQAASSKQPMTDVVRPHGPCSILRKCRQEPLSAEQPKRVSFQKDTLQQKTKVLPSSLAGMYDSFAQRFKRFLGTGDKDALNTISKMEEDINKEIQEYNRLMDEANIRAALIAQTQKQLEDVEASQAEKKRLQEEEDEKLAREHQRLEEAKAEISAKKKVLEEAKAQLAADQKRVQETEAAIQAEEQCLEEDKTAIQTKEEELFNKAHSKEVQTKESLFSKAFQTLPYLLALLCACTVIWFAYSVLGDHTLPHGNTNNQTFNNTTNNQTSGSGFKPHAYTKSQKTKMMADAFLYMGSYVVGTYMNATNNETFNNTTNNTGSSEPLMAVASDIDAWLYLGSYAVDMCINVMGGFFYSLV